MQARARGFHLKLGSLYKFDPFGGLESEPWRDESREELQVCLVDWNGEVPKLESSLGRRLNLVDVILLKLRIVMIKRGRFLHSLRRTLHFHLIRLLKYHLA